MFHEAGLKDEFYFYQSHLAHSFGIKAMHHTCGAVRALIPDFIECGLDVLQSLQPAAAGMDMQEIKKEYGRYICFQGGIDIQHTIPFGSPSDVEKEVLDRIKILGPGGGYILCTAHNMQADVPVENAVALFDAAGRYGNYQKTAEIFHAPDPCRLHSL